MEERSPQQFISSSQKCDGNNKHDCFHFHLEYLSFWFGSLQKHLYCYYAKQCCFLTHNLYNNSSHQQHTNEPCAFRPSGHLVSAWSILQSRASACGPLVVLLTQSAPIDAKCCVLTVWWSLVAMTGGLSCLTGASLCPALGFCDSSCHSNPKRAVVMRSRGSSDWACVLPEESACVGPESISVFSSPECLSHSSVSSQTCGTEGKCH